MPAVGTSLFLIAVGAILRYAVTANVSGVSRPTVGLILMIVGGAGLLITLIFMWLHMQSSEPGPRRRHGIDHRDRYR